MRARTTPSNWLAKRCPNPYARNESSRARGLADWWRTGECCVTDNSLRQPRRNINSREPVPNSRPPPLAILRFLPVLHPNPALPPVVSRFFQLFGTNEINVRIYIITLLYILTYVSDNVVTYMELRKPFKFLKKKLQLKGTRYAYSCWKALVNNYVNLLGYLQEIYDRFRRRYRKYLQMAVTNRNWKKLDFSLGQSHSSNRQYGSRSRKIT